MVPLLLPRVTLTATRESLAGYPLKAPMAFGISTTSGSDRPAFNDTLGKYPRPIDDEAVPFACSANPGGQLLGQSSFGSQRLMVVEEMHGLALAVILTVTALCLLYWAGLL